MEQSERMVPPPTRAKRGRYTSRACTECKKNKTKCRPISEGHCERCIANQLHCVYLPKPCKRFQRVNHRSGSEHASNDDFIHDEVKELRYEITKLREIVGASNGECSSELQTEDSATVSQPQEGVHQGRFTATSPSSPQEDAYSFARATQPAYGFIVGEESLSRMSGSAKADPVREASPQDWKHYEDPEILRLFDLWLFEIDTDVSFLDKDTFRDPLYLIRQWGTQNDLKEQPGPGRTTDSLHRDTAMVILCTGLVLDEKNACDLVKSTVETIQARFFLQRFPGAVTLQRVQFLIALGIYYFLANEELQAWRVIGLAARDATELGLHEKPRLSDNFVDATARQNALRVFWCTYILDRRWSFGTGLPFTLADADIDPHLPELDDEHAYLKCSVGYSRLCSRIRPLISTRNSILREDPDKAVNEFDLNLQEWYQSIPSYLQFRHPHSRVVDADQPLELQRLRTLLHLRGNHARYLVHRRYVLSAKIIRSDLERAWVAVNIAEDTIHVLTHLNATTTIYAAQPQCFQYYLTSALAVIFLAMCHAPKDFVSPLHKCFVEAVELLKIYSHHNPTSKHVWKSMRQKLERIRSIGLHDSTQDRPLSQEGTLANKGGETLSIEACSVTVPGQQVTVNNRPPGCNTICAGENIANSSSATNLSSQDQAEFDFIAALADLDRDFLDLDDATIIDDQCTDSMNFNDHEMDILQQFQEYI